MRGPAWKYKDARGVEYVGVVVHVSDFGGTDISHHMRATDGSFSILSGQRLRDAKRIEGTVEVPDTNRPN